MKNKQDFFDILIGAIRRETEAFNYYHQASQKAPSEQVRSLLVQLAEEERKHRIILIQEFQNLTRLVSGKDAEEFIKKDEVSFHLPPEPAFKRAQSLKSVDLAALSLPSELAGGDFFDTFLVKDRNQLGLLLFDVMGHGLEATELKAKTRAEWGRLKELYLEKEAHSLLLEPSSVLAHLNRFVWAECHRLACFLTMVYIILDPSKKKLVYSSAGHEPPLLFGSDGQRSLTEAGLLLGIDKDTNYPEGSAEIGSGDVLLLFSDGVVENLNSKDEEFGSRNLIPVVEKNVKEDSAQIVRRILSALRDFTGDQPVVDEFTLAVAKVK
jgi:sigma-B regulation protein RsbU (phosphoserine phosphatase)